MSRSRRSRLAVTEVEGAYLLSLPVATFLELVEAAVLPPPVVFEGKHRRWSVAALEAGSPWRESL